MSAAQDSYDPSACTACRGSGEVISGLGGTPHRVRCPWCDGSGRFILEHDAQAAGGVESQVAD